MTGGLLRAGLAFWLFALSHIPGFSRAQSPPVAAPTAEPSAAEDAARGTALFRQNNCAAAQPLLTRARQAPGAEPDLSILLGICLLHSGESLLALQVLLPFRAHSDPEIAEAARLFIALAHRELGAEQAAQRELERLIPGAARPPGPGPGPGPASASRLVLRAGLALEFDGNVPLTDRATYEASPTPSMDGNAVISVGFLARPFRQRGLMIGDTLTYRPQFRLHAYTFLHNTTSLAYQHTTSRHRLLVAGAFSQALLDYHLLYLDGEGRLSYRHRPLGNPLIGVNLAYLGRYRDHPAPEFASFTGHTHQLQLDVQGQTPHGLLFWQLGVQGLREQLAAPDPTVEQSLNFRAWGLGLFANLSLQPHRRVQLDAFGQYVRRWYSEQPIMRLDDYGALDLSATVLTKYVDVYLGGSLYLNDSTDAAFAYLKPVAYIGSRFRWELF